MSEHYGSRPTHGILKYADREFTIAYTAEYEQQLRRIVAEMAQLKSTDASLPFSRQFLCRECRQQLRLQTVDGTAGGQKDERLGTPAHGFPTDGRLPSASQMTIKQ